MRTDRRNDEVIPGEHRSPAPEFPSPTDWVNTREPLHLAGLRRRVVLLHFWSYDNVHCINLLAGLRQLEHKYHEGLSVLGVHTPKYPGQQSDDAVLKAINRNYVRHPVANDAHWRMWQQYGIESWPTMLLVDCEGNVAGRFVGEASLRRVDDAIAALLEDAAARDLRDYSPAETTFRTEPRMALRFPAHALAAGDRLYVADTGHNRILECTQQGKVVRQFGSGNAGYWDGRLTDAGFNAPQGLAISKDALYVADTGNHCVRRIQLLRGEVETLLGTGLPGHQLPEDSPPGQRIAISAPVAIAVADDSVYMALSGQHQVWRIDLRNGAIDVPVGAGRESAMSNARLAQPAALASLPHALLVADAAGNAILQLRLSDLTLISLAGGGSYELGHNDGPGGQARFAHPCGVAADGDNAYVADTFNSRLRIVNLQTGETSTLRLEWRLHEPQGLSFAEGSLWVADRNAHEILRVDLDHRRVERIPVAE